MKTQILISSLYGSFQNLMISISQKYPINGIVLHCFPKLLRFLYHDFHHYKSVTQISNQLKVMPAMNTDVDRRIW